MDWSPSIRSFAGLVWVTGGPERARTWAARILLSVTHTLQCNTLEVGSLLLLLDGLIERE